MLLYNGQNFTGALGLCLIEVSNKTLQKVKYFEDFIKPMHILAFINQTILANQMKSMSLGLQVTGSNQMDLTLVQVIYCSSAKTLQASLLLYPPFPFHPLFSQPRKVA